MLALIACSGPVAGAVLLVPSAVKTTSATAATTKAAAHARGNSAVATLSPGAPEFGDIATSSPLTYEQCQAQIQVPCCGPTQLEQAYGTPALYARGSRAGPDDVIIDPFGSPTIASDLATFDQGYGLPDPRR